MALKSAHPTTRDIETKISSRRCRLADKRQNDGRYGNCSETSRILSNVGEFAPSGEAGRELLAVERSAQQMSLQCEMLPNRSEAREKYLCVFGSQKPRVRRSRSRVGW
jgi:hypothetical protein